MAVAEAEAESFATDGRYDEALIAFERALSNCDSENCARLQRRIEDLHRQIELASWNEQRDGGERDSADAAQTALRDLAAGSGSRNTLEDLRPNNETEPINRTGLEFVSPEGDIGDQSYTDTSVVDLGFIDPNRLPVIDPRSARGESQIRDAAGSDSGSQLLTGEALERAEIGARAEASLSLGRAFAERGEHGRAIPYLREALALSPDCMACRQELANAELLNTDTLAWLADEAARYWRDIAREVFGVTAEDVLLEDELQSSSADYILDALLYGDGNWDNSLRYINDVAMARPDDREARDAMMYIRGLVNGVTPLDDNS